MTATPKPDALDDGMLPVRLGRMYVSNDDNVAAVRALLAEAPTMGLPADHPYWEVPDDLRRGMHWDRDLERFTARGEIARVLRDAHGWTLHDSECGLGNVEGSLPRFIYEVRPPERPKVTQVPAREVAKRLIDGERVEHGSSGPVLVYWPNLTERHLVLTSVDGALLTYDWDSTVPVVEDGAS